MRVSNDTLRSAFLAALDDARRRIIGHAERKYRPGQRDQLAVRRSRRGGAHRAARCVAVAARSIPGERGFRAQPARARGRVAERGDRQSAAHPRADAASQQRARERRRSPGHRRARSAQHRDALLRDREHDRRRRPPSVRAATARRPTPFTIAPAAASSTTAIKDSARCKSATAASSRSTTPAPTFSSASLRATARSCSSANAANTGTGTLGVEQRRESGGLGADTYTVTFLTPTSYEVRNSASALVASGTFTPSQSLDFRGIEMRIDGAPAAGDTFTVAPSAQRDVFATLDRLDHGAR